MVIAQWNHFGFSNPYANFGDVDGTLVYDADDVSASSVEVTLPLTGMDSFSDDFDKHLLSADFFDIAKFPAATFKSTKVEAAGEGKLKVTGDLTIKDITKRSEEHTSALQSLMRISYAVFCLKKKKMQIHRDHISLDTHTS